MRIWTPNRTWQDAGPGPGFYPHVREGWSVAGPAPFGGLVCRDDEHAAEVCAELNRMASPNPGVRIRQIAGQAQWADHGCVERMERERLQATTAAAVSAAAATAAAWDEAVAKAAASGDPVVNIRETLRAVDGDTVLWSVVHTATLVRDGDGFHLEDERWT